MTHEFVRKQFRWFLFFTGILALFLMTAELAHAQVLDKITDGYKSASAGWFAPMETIAKSLFWKLAAIEFAWSAIVWALQHENMQAFTAVVVKKIMGIGFFYFILANAGYWIPAIIDSLKKSGQTASGTTSLTPSEVFDTGIDIANVVLTGLHDKSLFSDFMTVVVGGLSALMIVIAFLIIAGQLIIALIESYIVVSAGVLFLGFGGSRWTTDFTQKYISYAFATGVKLLMLYLIIGVGMAQANTWAVLLATTDFTNILTVLGGSLLLAFLAFQIPNMAAGMLSGAPSLTGGVAAGTIGAVTAGTIATGGAALSPAMQSARGGMQALKAGYDHHRAAGGGMLSSAIKAVGTSTVDYSREAARSGAEAVGLAPASSSQASTIGGRAAEGRRSATDVMREEQAAGQGGDGKNVPPPAAPAQVLSGSTSNQSASNTATTGDSAPDSSTNTATPPPMNQTRQASDSMADNAPKKMGSAAPQKTAANQSASNNLANNSSAPDKPIFGDIHQVRPPNIPNDSAPQAGVQIRLNHSDD